MASTRKFISHVLTRIVERHPMSRLDELLPFAYLKSGSESGRLDHDAYSIALLQVRNAQMIHRMRHVRPPRFMAA